MLQKKEWWCLKMENRQHTLNIVMVALFAALTFVATQSIRIPLPGAFVHTGNVMVLLSVLLLGYPKGALAGGLGLAIFDLLNGYATEAPYFILESFIVGGVAWFIFHNIFKEKVDTPQDLWKITITAIGTGIAKIFMTQLKNVVVFLFMGQKFSLAFPAATAKLPATLINVVMTIILVTFLFLPLDKALKKYHLR